MTISALAVCFDLQKKKSERNKCGGFDTSASLTQTIPLQVTRLQPDIQY